MIPSPKQIVNEPAANATAWRRWSDRVKRVWQRKRERASRTRLPGEQEEHDFFERIYLLLKGAHDIILISGPDLRIIEVNDRAIEAYGYSHAEFLQMRLPELRVPAMRAELPGLLEKVTTDDGATFQTVHRRKDGSSFQVSGSARHIAINGIRYNFCIVHDRSEDLRIASEAKQAIELAARTRRTLLDTLEDQTQSQKLLSQSEYETRGVLLGIMEDQAQSQKLLRQSEAEMRRVLAISDERSLALLSLAEDQKETEAALRAREKTYQTLVSGLPDIVMRLDTRGHHLFVSDNVGEKLGIPADQFIGKTLAELGFPGELCRQWEQAIGAAVTSRKPSESEFTLETKRGRLTFDWRLTPELDATGEVESLLSIARDISGQRATEEREQRLQQQLEELQRMEALGILAGGVAHDLNNILGPLVMLPNILIEELDEVSRVLETSVASKQAEAVNVEAMKESLQVIKESSVRAAKTVTDLALLSRRGHYELAFLNLNGVIADLETSREVAALKQLNPAVSLKISPSSRQLSIRGSPSHLSRVLFNLIHNAFDALAGQGTVTLTANTAHFSEPYLGREIIPRGDYVVIRVADTGSGIPEDILPRIFEPYFSRKKRTQTTGSGLGLAIVLGIVKDHAGFMDVVSQIGQGTTFDIYLPFSAGTADAPADPATLNVIGTEHVLVVDDEPGQRHLAQRALTHQGYRVAMASNGREAVALFQKVRENCSGSFPDLVILDMVMEEDFDGLTTCQAMLDIRPGQRIIITSGYSLAGRIVAAQELGSRWLPKPYTAEELLTAVRVELDTPHPSAGS